MSTNELFSTIESARFAARLTVASDLKTFLRAARREEAIKELHLATKKTGGGELFERIIELVANPFDDNFQNPYDAAVAIYLWMLSSINEELGRNAASKIARVIRPCWWWAREMAGEILQVKTKLVTVNPRYSSTTTASLDFTQFFGGLPQRITHPRDRSELELVLGEIRI